jgi:hypothetical protein
MVNVHPFHRDELMNVASVSSYLSQTAPVQFDSQQFSFSGTVEQHISSVPGCRCYDIWVNGRKVYKPHRDEFLVTKERSDRISDVELFELSGADKQRIGCGWYARTDLLAALPPAERMRGIRVRQGNIEVGDEYFLSRFFTERRFSTWHVGEIHLSTAIRLNARRDGFEQSSDYERFLEQAHVLGKHLSALCRKSSDDRSTATSLTGQLSRLEHQLKANLFLDETHFVSAIDAAWTALARVETVADKVNANGALLDRIERVRKTLASIQTKPLYVRDSLDNRCLRHLDGKELLTEFCSSVMREYPTASSAQELVFRLLTPYLKPCAAHNLDSPQR